METEPYFEGTLNHNDIDIDTDDESSPRQKQKSMQDEITGAVDDAQSRGFDCNICLDSVHEPVVTVCGHLYCWPCIYKWLRYQNQKNQQCPVCKARISLTSLIPLYGRGCTPRPSKSRVPHLGVVIPQRPRRPTCGVHENSPRSTGPAVTSHLNHPSYYYYNSSRPLGRYLGGTAMNLFDPLIGMFGEMVYTRLFRNSSGNVYRGPNTFDLEEISSPTVRRYLARADQSLNNLCIFLFCFLVMCLLLF